MITGIVIAAYFKNSPKTKSGRLSSTEMTKGIIKKVGILLLVAVAHRIDITLQINYIMYATEISLIVEETLSIIENLGTMGVPIPVPIKNSIEILNKKIDEIMKGD